MAGRLRLCSFFSRSLLFLLSSSRPPRVLLSAPATPPHRLSTAHPPLALCSKSPPPPFSLPSPPFLFPPFLAPGVRSFTARPVLSSDNPGDKHKMERFLHAGSHAVASVYAPISYGPLPALAFMLPEASSSSAGAAAPPSAAGGSIAGGASGISASGRGLALLAGGSGAELAAAGAVRGCDPDRIVLKKITLTGERRRERA